MDKLDGTWFLNVLLTGDYNDYLSSSNHVDSATLPPATSLWDNDHADLPELFSKLGLGKYSDLFRQQEVSLFLVLLLLLLLFCVLNF